MPAGDEKIHETTPEITYIRQSSAAYQDAYVKYFLAYHPTIKRGNESSAW